MSELVQLTSYTDRPSADLAASRLKSCDIEAFVMADDMAGLRPHLSMGLGVRLMVPEHLLAQAREILELDDAVQVETIKDPAAEIIKRVQVWLALGIFIFPIIGMVVAVLLLIVNVNKLKCSEYKKRGVLLFVVGSLALAVQLYVAMDIFNKS